MANPKQGLDYFDLSVDFFDDDKIALTEAKYGIEGTYITLRLLAKIYRFGFYIHFGEDEAALFARSCGNGITARQVLSVVEELVRRDFFNKKLYEKHQILTSRGIQQRYFNATKRRTSPNCDPEFILVESAKPQKNTACNMYAESEILHAESKIMSTESKIMYAESTQSRVDNIRVDNSTPPLTPPHGEDEQEGGGDIFSSVSFLEMKNKLTDSGVDADSVSEALRISDGAHKGYATTMLTSWLDKKDRPFHEVLQYLQQLVKQNRYFPKYSYEDWQALWFVRFCPSILESDRKTILQRLRASPKMLSVVSQCRDQYRKGGINQPGKFILSQIRKSSIPKDSN